MAEREVAKSAAKKSAAKKSAAKKSAAKKSAAKKPAAKVAPRAARAARVTPRPERVPAPEPVVAPVARPPAGRPAITTTGLTKRFGNGVVAVDDLSITVPSGAVVGFVGPNGSGKTTTIRMLLGLIKPSAGSGTVLDEPLSNPGRFLPEVGALVEEPAFYPALDARRNLLVHCRLRAIDEGRIDATLAAVGLEEAAGRAVGEYSLGMRKRLGIAATLLPNPKLLILDEPANGLDPIGIRDVRQLLRHLVDQGRTVFVSSHLLSEVEQACDEIVMIQHGRLIFQGPIDELLDTNEAELVVATEDAAGHAVVRQLCAAAGHAAEQRGEHIYVRAPASFSGELNRQAMAVGVTIVELRRERADLERVFFDLTGPDRNEARPKEAR